METGHFIPDVYSGVATEEPPLTAKKLPKIGKKRKNREKEVKSGRKGKNREGSFTLPLLTDRAGYVKPVHFHSSVQY